MFPNLLRIFARRGSAHYEGHFVEQVRVQEKRPRNPSVDRLFLIAWILIAIKSVLVLWAVPHYHIPFSGWWVVAPTLIFAALCTAVYYGRR